MFERQLTLLGLVVALAGVGITILWPSKRWVGWAFLGAGILVAVGDGAWSLTRDNSVTAPQTPAHIGSTAIGIGTNTPLYSTPITGDYTARWGDVNLECGAGTFTVTLYAVSEHPDARLTIHKNGTGITRVVATPGETINNTTNAIELTDGQ